MDAVEPVEKKAKSRPEVPIIELPPKAYALRDCETVNEVASDLTCAICLGVLCEPVQCNGGGHLYCRECITPVAKHMGARCPVGGDSCKPLTTKTLLVVPAVIRNILNAVEIKCPQKCVAWSGTYESLKQHLFVCPYRKVQCGWCKAHMEYNVMFKHETVCNKRSVNCDFCEESLRAEQLDIHVNEYCKRNPFRMIKCLCGETVLMKEHEEHMIANAAKHVVLMNKYVKTVSNIRFRWDLVLKETKQAVSGSIAFGGLVWCLKTDVVIGETFGVYLFASKSKLNDPEIIRCVTFKIKSYANGRDVFRSDKVYYKNDGTACSSCQNDNQWKRQGFGKKELFKTQLGYEYIILCTVKIIH